MRSLSISCLLVVTAATAFAQQTERIVPLTESIGYHVDADERDLYGLFPDIEGFVQAELLLRDDGHWIRIVSVTAGERFVSQRIVSGAELAAWRQQVRHVEAGGAVEAPRSLSEAERREGRLRLVTDVFAYGLGLYGPGIRSLLDIDSDRGTAAIQLLAGGTAFTGGLHATRDHRLGYARTTLVRWGAYAGTFYGFAGPTLFDVDADRALWASMMVSTPAGGWLAHRWTAGRRFGKGDADLISTSMWVGGVYGAALPYLLGGDEDTSGKVYLGSSMAGVAIGTVLSSELLRGRPVNRGRAHLVILGGFLGVASSLTLVDLVDADASDRALAWTAAVGAPVGVWAATQATRGRRHSLNQARMISVGAYAGGLAGRGVAVVVGLGTRAGNVAGMAGAGAGVWLTDQLTRDWGQDMAQAESTHGWQLHGPSPAALANLGMMASDRGGDLPPMPLLHLSF